MGTIHKHPPVKLFTAITYHSKFDIDPIIYELEKRHSTIDIKSEVYNFSEFTSYYRREMSDDLRKCFVAFDKLIAPEDLQIIKVNTNTLEEHHLLDKKRQVNLDPGYITQAKVILATTKNYSHRIYIGNGIYGDVHLQYGNKSYQPQPWTYPDYKDAQNIAFFNLARERYQHTKRQN
jgi:hypothetical protein